MGFQNRCSAVVSNEGTVYFGSLDQKLHALTGAKRYRSYHRRRDFSSPALALDDSMVIFGSADQRVYGLTTKDAQRRNYDGDVVYSSPAVANGSSVYVGAEDNNLYGLTVDGMHRWTFSAGNDFDSSPVVATDGTVYAGSKDSFVRNYSHWEAQVEIPYWRRASSPALGRRHGLHRLDDHSLYAVTPDGKLVEISD